MKGILVASEKTPRDDFLNYHYVHCVDQGLPAIVLNESQGTLHVSTYTMKMHPSLPVTQDVYNVLRRLGPVEVAEEGDDNIPDHVRVAFRATIEVSNDTLYEVIAIVSYMLSS